MRRTFRGESTHKVDGKGRVSIPAGFRRVIEAGDPEFPQIDTPGFVIVYGGRTRDYLEAFTMDGISEIEAKIAARPVADKRRIAMETLYNIQSVDASVDNTGRIVLPQKCREKLGIAGEVEFRGRGASFEIWKPETLTAKQDQLLTADESFDPDVDPSVYLDGDWDEGA